MPASARMELATTSEGQTEVKLLVLSRSSTPYEYNYEDDFDDGYEEPLEESELGGVVEFWVKGLRPSQLPGQLLSVRAQVNKVGRLSLTAFDSKTGSKLDLVTEASDFDLLLDSEEAEVIETRVRDGAVFVSHATKDADIAGAVVSEIESRGRKCWIALARNEQLGRTPPFWRRLAAHAHAALVVRASANVKGTQQELISWATGHSGATYMTSVLRDFVIDPRWRPDWIASTFVVADIWGRANAVLTSLGDRAPAAWRERIDKVKVWLEEHHALSSAHFPAPLEGMRRDLAKLEDMGPLADRFRALESNPTIEGFVRLTPLIHAFMPPPEFEAPAIALTRRLLRPLSAEDAPFASMTLALAAHTAALMQSTALGAAVAETTVALVRRRSDIIGVGDAVCRLLEANAAIADRMEADAALGRHFEVLALAFTFQSDLAHLRDFLLALQGVDPILAPRLGRAIAVADLGANRAGASA